MQENVRNPRSMAIQVLINSILQMKRFVEQDEIYIMTHELKAQTTMIAMVLIFP
jgi:hypothetical protein